MFDGRLNHFVRKSIHEGLSLSVVVVDDVVEVGADRNLVGCVVLVDRVAVTADHCLLDLFAFEELPAILTVNALFQIKVKFFLSPSILLNSIWRAIILRVLPNLFSRSDYLGHLLVFAFVFHRNILPPFFLRVFEPFQLLGHEVFLIVVTVSWNESKRVINWRQERPFFQGRNARLLPGELRFLVVFRFTLVFLSRTLILF